jgi:hypothetical protein
VLSTTRLRSVQVELFRSKVTNLSQFAWDFTSVSNESPQSGNPLIPGINRTTGSPTACRPLVMECEACRDEVSLERDTCVRVIIEHLGGIVTTQAGRARLDWTDS